MPFLASILAPLGAVISLFLSYRVARITAALILAEGLYLIVNAALQNFITLMVAKFGELTLECHIVHFINGSGIIPAASTLASILLSAALFRKVTAMLGSILTL